jgi:hypothetical protein
MRHLREMDGRTVLGGEPSALLVQGLLMAERGQKYGSAYEEGALSMCKSIKSLELLLTICFIAMHISGSGQESRRCSPIPGRMTKLLNYSYKI